MWKKNNTHEIGKRRVPPPSSEQIAESAAHLVATIEDPEVGLHHLPTRGEFNDSFSILRAQCEAAGLMREYPKSDDGRYRLWPLSDSRKHASERKLRND